MATKLFSLDAQAQWEYAGALTSPVVQLRDFLDDAFGQTAVVLHDQVAPTTNEAIDHLVVASSGVWVIDAHHRLHTEVIDSMQARCDAVASLLEPMGLRSVPVHPVLCVTEPEWSQNSKADVIHDVLVLSPDKLRSVVCQPGWLDDEMIEAIATRMRSGLAEHPATR